jgi:hypothetical protein
MPRKRFWAGIALVPLVLQSGCCWMCDRVCPHPVQAAPACVPCCPAPACCPPTSSYAPANWSNPQRAPTAQGACYCQ